jgi:hypothetical protein
MARKYYEGDFDSTIPTVIQGGRLNPERIKRMKAAKAHIKSIPPTLAGKAYMAPYIDELINDYPEMGFKIKVKVSFKNIVKDVGKFISQTASGIANIAENVARETTVAVKNVGTVSITAYNQAKKAVLENSPPFLRPYIGIAVAPLEFIGNPTATVQNITKDVKSLSKDLRTGVVGQVSTTLYQDVARPGFRVVRNIVNETAIKPALLVIDKSAAALLPTEIRKKLSEITEVAALAGRGKLTDKQVLEAMENAAMIGAIPAKIAGNFANDTINTLKKDAILGPFLEKVDYYTGGLLTSAQNLAAMPDDIYNDRDINWKARIVDGLKIYLATVSVSTLIERTAFTAVGAETGLDQTPLGRTALAAGQAYYSIYKMTPDEIAAKAAKDSTFATSHALYAAKEGAISVAKAETIRHSVANGWVDDAFTARMIMSAGGKFYDAAGSDKTLMDTMSDIHDHEFQKYVNYQISKQTGLPVKYEHLVDIYNTDWKRLAEQVSNAMSRLVPSPGSNDESFLARMGKNFLEEMKRVPGNLYNLGPNIIAELERSPANLAKFAKAVASEAERTPENVVKIAENIARESETAAKLIVAEAARTPGNVVEIATNIARETGVGVENVIDELRRFDPSLSIGKPSIKFDIPSLDDLIRQFGPTIIQLLQDKYPGWNESMPLTDEMYQYVMLKKKGNNFGLLAGMVGLLALGYMAMGDE